MRWLDGGTRRSERTDSPTAVVAALAAQYPDGEVPGLEVTRPSLEDVYLELIGEPVASSDPAPAPHRPGAPAAARTPDDATVVVPEEARP